MKINDLTETLIAAACGRPHPRSPAAVVLKLSGRHVGLLINLDVKLLENGVGRLVNELPESALRTLRALR